MLKKYLEPKMSNQFRADALCTVLKNKNLKEKYLTTHRKYNEYRFNSISHEHLPTNLIGAVISWICAGV